MVAARSRVRLTVCGASSPSAFEPSHERAAALTCETVRSFSRTWPRAGTTRELTEWAYTARVLARFDSPAVHRAAHSPTVTAFGSGGCTSFIFWTHPPCVG